MTGPSSSVALATGVPANATTSTAATAIRPHCFRRMVLHSLSAGRRVAQAALTGKLAGEDCSCPDAEWDRFVGSGERRPACS